MKEEKEKYFTSLEWLYETIVACVTEFDGKILTEKIYRAWVTLPSRQFDIEGNEEEAEKEEKKYYDVFMNAYMKCNKEEFDQARFSLAYLGMTIFDMDEMYNELSTEKE